MITISMTELVALLVLLPVFGALIGYVVAGDRMRRAAGGKTPVELREELDEYRAGVTAHFQQTADLLGGMTEQYRAVYTHMARGAEQLCESVEPGPRLEQLRSELLDVQPAAQAGDDGPEGADSEGPGDGAPVPEPQQSAAPDAHERSPEKRTAA